MAQVELVYVPEHEAPIHLSFVFVPGTTVAALLQQSGLAEKYPEVLGLTVGIFSKPVSMETVVRAGDRIELYRALLIDPKEKRRKRTRACRQLVVRSEN